MMAFQTQKSVLPTSKSITFINPLKSTFQPTIPKPQNSIIIRNINMPSPPQIVQVNNFKRKNTTSFPEMRNAFINGINTKNFNTLTAYKQPKTLVTPTPNYNNRTFTNQTNSIVRTNVINNGNLTPNQNIINRTINNPNIMNNMTINQNLINTINSIKNNNIIKPTPNGQTIIINNINNNTLNQKPMRQIPIQQIINQNGMVQNQKTINSINAAPTNISLAINNNMNPIVKPVNNNISVIPKVEIKKIGNNTNVSLIPNISIPLAPAPEASAAPVIQAAPAASVSSIATINKSLLSQQQLLNQSIVPSNNVLRNPGERLNLTEFRVINEIGQGTFGKIYKVLWMKNNKLYALKKEVLRDIEGVKIRQHRNEAIRTFIKLTNCQGIVNLYGNLTIPNGYEYQYFELMDLCSKDFEKEIKERSVYQQYYTEPELYNIMFQLISTLSFLQRMHITHRDIKPQNILISNGLYKLCDFGDIRVMQNEGVVVQRVRGSELYMSPILFKGLRDKAYQVRHNTYKSDVFSLGMCFLLAACLSFDGCVEIREVLDMNQKEFILNKYLGRRYSSKIIRILHSMLQTEEMNRPDFIMLEAAIKQLRL